MSTFNCSSCMLGYETASLDNATCVKPEFRPYRAWAANYSRLRLHETGASGDTGVGRAFGTGGVTEPTAHAVGSSLLAGHTCTTPAPLLEPKDKKFVGYVNRSPAPPCHFMARAGSKS